MGLRNEIKQESRSVKEDLGDIRKSITSKAVKFKESLSRNKGGNKPKPKKKVTLKEKLSKAGESLRIDKKAKALKFKIDKLDKKIKSGEATLKDRLEYTKLKGLLKQIPIQVGIAAAQAGSLAVAPVLYPVGTVAAGAAALVGSKLAGSDESNKRLIKRHKSGKSLSMSERYRLRKAMNLGKKKDSK